MENKQLDTKIDYQQLEQSRTQLLQRRLNQQLREREMGNQYSLRRAVLAQVVQGNYKEAGDVIDAKSVYPAFKERSVAHAVHAKELINAVRAKRNFPNLSQLSMSKQQEILDHAVEHFDELRMTLKTIEHLLKDEAVKDIKSTVWVLRTGVYATISIVAAAFIGEFSGSMGRPLWIVFNDIVDIGYKFLMNYIPFL